MSAVVVEQWGCGHPKVPDNTVRKSNGRTLAGGQRWANRCRLCQNAKRRGRYARVAGETVIGWMAAEEARTEAREASRAGLDRQMRQAPRPHDRDAA